MACEAADLLSEMGKKVTLIGEGKKIAPEMLNIIRNVLLRRLKEKGVVMLTEAKMRAVTPSGVEVVGKDGAGKELVADTVVLGNNYRLDTNLISPLRKHIPRVYLIGGWRGFHEQQDAVADGYMAGLLA
jgi:thioredoxin reductase